MPPSRKPANITARVAPYSTSTTDVPLVAEHWKPGTSIFNEQSKENQAPPMRSSPNAKTRAQQKPQSMETIQIVLSSSYSDIELEEIKGEVPVYEDAAVIRRKLNKLLESKTNIPGSIKKWNKTNLSQEMQKVADQHHPIKTHNGVVDNGPGVAALTRFLKKSGYMGGGDSASYYFGNMLLEKLRIWNGDKKTNAREEAEKEFPNGRERLDPEHVRYTCAVWEPVPSYSEIANSGR